MLSTHVRLRSRRRRAFRVAIAGALISFLFLDFRTVATAAALKPDIAPVGVAGADPKFFCRKVDSDFVLDNKRLADWLNNRNELLGPDEGGSKIRDLLAYDPQSRTQTPPPPDLWKDLSSKTQDKLKAVQQVTYVDIIASGGGFQIVGSGAFDVTSFFSQSDTTRPIKVICETKASSEISLASAKSLSDNFQAFRIRGVPDTLAVDRANGNFSAADKATVSLSHDGTKKTDTVAVQATVGYSLLSSKSSDQLVPYITVAKNSTTTSGALTKTSKDYVDAGFLVGNTSDFSVNFLPPIAPGQPRQGANFLSATPGYLFNQLDHSRLAHIHFADMPVVGGWFNDCIIGCSNKSAPLEIASIFDVRGDVGYYATTGNAPITNKSYGQLGTQVGALVSIDALSSDISITQVYLRGTSAARRVTSDFEASWTINLIPKFIGLQLAYKNGLLEATGQRENSWMLSLSGKY